MGYKITQPCNISLSAFIIFCAVFANAQSGKLMKPIPIVNTISGYKETMRADISQRMANLRQFIPNIVLDLRYGTKNNFVHKIMYAEKPKYTFMRLPAVKLLLGAQKELNKKGYGLKIFDAYRPYSVTRKFWELVHDERYVADPALGSGHNRGIAVDLTIIDLKTKKELKMPTGFDSFSDSAHHDFNNLPVETLQNRELLKSIMIKHGFVPLNTEWWHYSLPGAEKYEVMDFAKF
ncbi:MAG: M15 family metallopeptidase [Bacteroidetes bacterium]|nr:M15 family metallopeptidase [Bacteroidota bacterium]